MLIAQPAHITIKYEHTALPEAKAVQLIADSQQITVAYYNHIGNVIKAHVISVKDNPELARIAEYAFYDDVWDMEMVADLIDLTSPEDRAPELAPLVPAYLESIGVSY